MHAELNFSSLSHHWEPRSGEAVQPNHRKQAQGVLRFVLAMHATCEPIGMLSVNDG